MKTNRILAVFLTVSAVALGVPAQAATTEADTNHITKTQSETSNAPTATERLREDVQKSTATVGEYATDTVITTKVKAALVADESVKSLEISVKTIDNVVYLSGTVQSAAQIATAERLAKDVKDVKSVVNHLHVK